jgi:hypothetical protein
MLGRAGAGLDGNGAEGRGAALGENDAIHAGSVGDTQQSAEVLRIFDPVECEEESRCRGVGSGCVEIFKSEEFLRANQCNNSLVRGCFCGDGELLTGLLEDADVGLTALCQEAFEARIASLAGDQNVVKVALAGLEGFLDRVQAVKNFHEVSLRLQIRKAPDSGALQINASDALDEVPVAVLAHFLQLLTEALQLLFELLSLLVVEVLAVDLHLMLELLL